MGTPFDEKSQKPANLLNRILRLIYLPNNVKTPTNSSMRFNVCYWHHAHSKMKFELESVWDKELLWDERQQQLHHQRTVATAEAALTIETLRFLWLKNMYIAQCIVYTVGRGRWVQLHFAISEMMMRLNATHMRRVLFNSRSNAHRAFHFTTNIHMLMHTHCRSLSLSLGRCKAESVAHFIRNCLKKEKLQQNR